MRDAIFGIKKRGIQGLSSAGTLGPLSLFLQVEKKRKNLDKRYRETEGRASGPKRLG